MHRAPAIALTASSIALLPLIGTGCTHKQRAAVSETVVRNVVSTGSAKKFHDAGYPIDGNLNCQSVVDGKQISVSCTGRTTAGKPVSVKGAGTITHSDTTVRGVWKGTVGSRTTFVEKCLGAGC